MKVNPISPESSAFGQNLSINNKKPKIDFKSVLQAAQQKTDFGFDSSLKQLDKIRASLENSKSIDPRQILQYQVQLNELNLRVELVSKAAESAAALGRKLQNSQ